MTSLVGLPTFVNVLQRNGRRGPMKTDWDCIEFVHTAGWEARDRDDDELADFEELTAWCVRRDNLTDEEAVAFLSQARKQPDRAAETLVGAHRLRVLTYELLRAVARHEVPPAGRVEELNGLLQKLLSGRRLANEARAFHWAWRMDPYRPDTMLAPVVWSLAALVTSEERDRLKLCEADDCGWIFIDASRNRSRRWCDMSDCGNRAKVRRYRRRRGTGAP